MAVVLKVRAMNVSAAGRLPALAFGVALAALAPSHGWAQLGGMSGTGATGHPGRGVQNPTEKPPEPAPEAIPGAKAKLPAAPATRPVGDMEPNEALFDAINRGDIASARDALNRGADLNAVNILGMTPMELSVDLGRNDISFLLLSMRGEDSGRGSRALGRDTPPAGKTARGGKPAPDKTAPDKTAAAKAPAGRTVRNQDIPVAAKPVAKPKLFANDGGTPLPNAGFLGFGSRSAPN